MKKYLMVVCFFIIVSCDQSSGVDKEYSQINQPTPSQGIEKIISCSSLTKLNLIEAYALQNAVSYDASKVIDGSFISSSLWSTPNNDDALVLTLEDTSLLKGLAITWLNMDQRSYSYDVEVSQDKVSWLPVLTSQISNSSTTRNEYVTLNQNSARYIKIILNGSNMNDGNHVIEVEAFGCTKNIMPGIKLNDWYLSIPVDEYSNKKAKSVYEEELENGYFNAEFFFLSSDGGLVFRAPIEGAKTSSNTKYTRTELREMLRAGDTSINVQGVNKNNWVFSSAPVDDLDSAGGIDGELVAELAVNHVTETGDKSQIGRVIIGQIHANEDEPVRLYYRKLPQNEKGAIYFAHEIKGGDDIYYELIGTRSHSAENPEDGISINERFVYKITVLGNLLTVTIQREGKKNLVKTIDMNASGYDISGQYMYFKAGVYNQNNTGDPKDYVQATFYQIENSHTGYVDH